MLITNQYQNLDELALELLLLLSSESSSLSSGRATAAGFWDLLQINTGIQNKSMHINFTDDTNIIRPERVLTVSPYNNSQEVQLMQGDRCLLKSCKICLLYTSDAADE